MDRREDPKGVGRREFLRVAGCACAVVGPLPEQARPEPRPAPAPGPGPSELEEATLDVLQSRMRRGGLTLEGPDRSVPRADRGAGSPRSRPCAR